MLAAALTACGPAATPAEETTSAATTGAATGTAAPTSDTGAAGTSTTGAASTGAETAGEESWIPPVCGEDLFVPLVAAAPNIALVVERSGSLVAAANFWDHDADDPDDDGLTDAMTPATPRQARWPGVARAVKAMLAAHDHQVHVGLGLFPAASATNAHSAAACPVDPTLAVAVAAMHADAVVAALPAEHDETLAGASPATNAVRAALAGLAAVRDAGFKYVVLITDGPPNCQDDAADEAALLETVDPQLAVEIGEAFAQGIRTLVVGVAVKNVKTEPVVDSEPDGVRPFAQLKAAAIAGGATVSPWFYDAQDEAQLALELERIAALTVCTFPLEPRPDVPDYMELVVGGLNYGYARDDPCADRDGWRYVDHSESALELCNAACAQFMAGEALVGRLRCPND